MKPRIILIAVVVFVATLGSVYVWRACRPSKHAKQDAMFEYYGALNKRVQSGDIRAVEEIVTRMQHGPWPDIAYSIADELIPAIREVRRKGATDAECGEWLRENVAALVFDEKSRTYRLTDLGSQEPPSKPKP